MIDHATWAARETADTRPIAAARRLARQGIDLVLDDDALAESRALATDEA